MPFDGNGLFNRVHNWVTDKANSIKINASRMDEEFDGVATGLTTCITKDGQTVVTADLPMATYKHTSIGNAAARTDYAAAGQVQDGAFRYVAAGGTADGQTLTLAPAITAYSAGQMFWFLPVANNTGAATLNVSGVGAKNVQKSDGAGALTNLSAGDLDATIAAAVIYDGTQFQLLNPVSIAKLGIGSSHDLGVGIHVKSADSGATVSAGTDELVVEGSGDSGISILSGTSGTGALSFNDSGGQGRALFAYDHSADNLTITVDGSNTMVMKAGLVGIEESANADMTIGLTINQGASDDEILALKSSDVTHGYTTGAEIDTYGTFAKHTAATGGLSIVGYGEVTHQYGALNLVGYGNASTITTKTNSDFNSGIQMQYFGHSGGALANSGANANVFSISVYRAGATTWLWGLDEDGDYFYDGADGGAFDQWDDAALLRGLELWRADEYPETVGAEIKPSRFDGNRYTKEHLGRGDGGAKLIEVVSDDAWAKGSRSMMNAGQEARVVRGAIWQNHEMLDALMEALDEAFAELGVNAFQASRVRQKFLDRNLPTQILDWS